MVNTFLSWLRATARTRCTSRDFEARTARSRRKRAAIVRPINPLIPMQFPCKSSSTRQQQSDNLQYTQKKPGVRR